MNQNNKRHKMGGRDTIHPFGYTVVSLIFGTIALVGLAALAGSAGRSPRDRAFYAVIRRHVAIAPPAWLFGPAWGLWLILITLNYIFFALNPHVASHQATYIASFALFLAWLVFFVPWTSMFFRARAIRTALCFAILLLGITIA